ncbi:hypothetical protein QBC36DRAFT_326187 [Triangularia setosa]|uniref:Uncharacterized protein n=1 Tax=Triangularia setosa TaxID=2587417 RepID=A0AAN6WB30_9PEZI|nr:hypothetical protein QBC36DRAFT_326187 [Podospora setosa]
MFIPPLLSPQAPLSLASSSPSLASPTIFPSWLHLPFRLPVSRADDPVSSAWTSKLAKRYSMQEQNITIGVVVGVLVAAFLVGCFYFCHRYGRSIQVRRRGRSRRRGSRYGSKGSHMSFSASSGEGAPPPPPPPPPPPG